VPVTGHGEENDRPLSVAGHEAAQRLAATLSAEPVAAIYSSPYPRAIQTIEPLAETMGLGITVVTDLRERVLAPGDLPDWEEHCRRGWADFDYALLGGESSTAAQRRVCAVLHDLAARHPEQTIAIASHGNLIALALHAHDGSIGFDFWRTMPMPAVYGLDLE
jgi:2,3-bisphosphoglycerate-dependent phosphoglycerate mutase